MYIKVCRIKILVSCILYVWFFINVGYSQCPTSLDFGSQFEINEFPTKYGNCTSFDTLTLDDDTHTITDLSPLLGIKNVKRLEIKGLIKLESLYGLDSISELEDLYFAACPKISKDSYFKNLVKCDHVSHHFAGEDQDLSIYRRLKFVKTISFIFNGKLIGMDSLLPNPDLHLTIRQNELPNDVSHILPSQQDSINYLLISFSKNISLKGAELIKYIDILAINQVENCEFGHLLALEKVNRLSLTNIGLNTNFGISLNNLDTLITLSLRDNKYFDRIDQVIPNIKAITDAVILENNVINNLDFLSDMILPQRKVESVDPIYRPYNIYIRNNKNLVDCVNHFICRALVAYPDSVLINNNGPACNKESLMQSCLTSTEEEFSVIKNIYPNPSSGLITIDLESDTPAGYKMSLADLTGQKVFESVLTETNNTFDLSFLKSGMYIFSLCSDNKNCFYHKWVKTD